MSENRYEKMDGYFSNMQTFCCFGLSLSDEHLLMMLSGIMTYTRIQFSKQLFKKMTVGVLHFWLISCNEFAEIQTWLIAFQKPSDAIVCLWQN